MFVLSLLLAISAVPAIAQEPTQVMVVGTSR
jgi:hypothetical protein